MTTSTQSLDRPRGIFQAFADLSLRVKLIFVFLVVTLLAVGVIAYLNIRSTSAALTTQVSEGLVGLADSAGNDMGATLADHVASMQSFAPDPELQAGVAAQNAVYSGGTEAILAELTKLDEQWVAAGDDDPLVQERLTSSLATDLEAVKVVVPAFAEVFVTDRYGGLVATSDRTSDYYQADEGWWQAAYNDGSGAVFIAEPELDESTGVVGIDIAVPVYAQNNEIIGIMRTTLDVTALIDRLGHITLGETGGADLLLGEELFEAHEEGDEGGEHHALDPAALAQITTAPEGYLETVFEGQPALVGYAPVEPLTGEEYISDLGWKVVVHQVQSEALAAVEAQTRTTLVTALIVAFIALAVAIGMGQVLANPLISLTGTVAKFTEGDLSARIDIKSRDEAGVLATSFNHMAEQVGNLLRDVQARSAELEERTRELEASQGVTFAASERTSPEELLGMVVDLVRDQFDLYHVQMYMVDEEQQAAVLRESTGFAGSQLLQAGHQIPLDRTALVTKAINENQPVLVDDTGQDPNFMPNPLLPETQTELVVPLRTGERVLGALDIQDLTPGRFSESTVSLFQAMTDQVAFLFENNELLERVTDQTEALTVFTTQLRTAADIAEHLSTILDPEQLLHEMAELLQSRFGLYHAHIYTVDEAAGELVVRAGSGEVGRILRERGHSILLDAEKSLVARAARSQEPVLIEDTTLESDFMPNPLLPQTRAELSVPLVVGERVLGVLDMQDDQAGRFAPRDVDTFTTLAGLAAGSLQNAALFEQVEAGARRTQVRLDVSQALVGAESEEEVLDVLIQQMGIYPQTRPSIFTVDPETEELSVVVRRQAPLDSGLPPLEEGMRLPVSQFPSLQDSAEGKPFMSANLLLDEHVDPAVREIARVTGTLSELSLPLMAGGEYLGVISVSSPEEGFFDEHKLHLYRALAEQGATALQAARLRAEVQRNVARFQGFAESSGFGFGMGELTGQLTYANPALLRILGEESIEDATQKTFFEYYSEEGVKEMEGEILPTVMEKGQWVGEIPLLSSKGKLTPTEQNIFLIYDQEGQPRMVANIITDITRRKQREQALGESEERFRGFAESTDYGFGMGELTGQLTYANPALLRILGEESMEDATQKTFFEYYSEEGVKEMESEILPTVMEKGQWVGEIPLLSSKGKLTPTEQNIFLIYDQEGQPRMVANIITDITRRKQREQALHENEERLDLAMEAANAGVWEFWPQDDKAFFNDRWFAMLGYGPDELEHSYATWQGLLHPDDVEMAEGAVFPAVEKGSDFVIDFRMRTKDGGWRWIHDIGKTVEWTADGATQRMIGTHTDITEEKIAAEERERFTTQLRTAADLAEQMSAILDPEQLLREVVTQLQERFDLYHVHVYLLDEEGHDLVMRAGSGEVGQTMLEEGHKIPLDREKSLVARAARTQEIVSVADTSTAPDFLPNPLLPDTRSEVSVPLVIGGRVLGVFDVQDIQAGRFTQSDLDTFTTLAGQIAIALSNATLFAEQQQAEEALLRLEMAVEQSIDGIAIPDLEGNIQFVNHAWAQMHGYSVEELQGKHLSMFHTEEQLQEDVIPFNEKVMETGAHQGEVGHVRKDGTTFPTWMSTTVLKDEEGKPVGLVGTARDITAQKQTEQELRASEARFLDVVMSMSDWAWEVDAQGRYTYVSDKVVDVLGYTAEEMLGKTPFDLMSPEEAARVGEIFGGIVANKQPIVGLENWNVTKDGRELCMLTDGVPMLDQEGELIGYRGVDKDITAQKQAE